MGFLLFPADGVASQLVGFAHLASEPDNQRAEFALALQADFFPPDVARVLLERVIAYAKERRTCAIYGEFAANNLLMLWLCGQLGFSLTSEKEGLMRATLRLGD
jgi:acetyltransferase